VAVATEQDNVMKLLAPLFLACGLGAALSAQIPDFTPRTPLIAALLHNDAAEAARLLEAGADPNEGRFPGGGMPPLFLAIQRQDLMLVRLMADKGADLEARDASGSTPLMWAAFNETGDATIVEELLRHGADPMAANKSGETALNWASRRGETAAVAALRRAGAVDAAAIRQSVESAVALLEKSGTQFGKSSGCFSCHHQALPQMAMGVARTRGIQLDEAAARREIARISGTFRTSTSCEGGSISRTSVFSSASMKYCEGAPEVRLTLSATHQVSGAN
jgi:Ankyrin repeats (3 copies)